jgi:hypothetical protein
MRLPHEDACMPQARTVVGDELKKDIRVPYRAGGGRSI